LVEALAQLLTGKQYWFGGGAGHGKKISGIGRKLFYHALRDGTATQICDGRFNRSYLIANGHVTDAAKRNGRFVSSGSIAGDDRHHHLKTGSCRADLGRNF
jgi:hypothetical protein